IFLAGPRALTPVWCADAATAVVRAVSVVVDCHPPPTLAAHNQAAKCVLAARLTVGFETSASALRLELSLHRVPGGAVDQRWPLSGNEVAVATPTTSRVRHADVRHIRQKLPQRVGVPAF